MLSLRFVFTNFWKFFSKCSGSFPASHVTDILKFPSLAHTLSYGSLFNHISSYLYSRLSNTKSDSIKPFPSSFLSFSIDISRSSWILLLNNFSEGLFLNIPSSRFSNTFAISHDVILVYDILISCIPTDW